jgi:hypothetical protein
MRKEKAIRATGKHERECVCVCVGHVLFTNVAAGAWVEWVPVVMDSSRTLGTPAGEASCPCWVHQAQAYSESCA